MDNEYMEAIAQVKANLEITWDDIEEVEPDEIDLAMMAEMENDPDCTVYITQDELLAKRKLEEKMKEAV